MDGSFKNHASNPRRVVVIGGSLAGLFVANMLIRRGWEADIFERADEGLASRGAGIALHEELIGAMNAAGMKKDPTPGIKVDGRAAFDSSGKELARYRYPQYLTAWSRVYNALYAAFPAGRYHHGCELADIEQRDGGKGAAKFADGSEVEADLIIGADGFRSKVRAVLAPDAGLQYGGYVAWRGLIHEDGVASEFKEDMFRTLSFCFPPHSEFIGYLVPGADDTVVPGHRRYSFLWYRPADLSDVLRDESGRIYQHSIPPPLIRRTHIDALKRDAGAYLPAQFAEVVQRADQYLVQPIYDVASDVIGRGNLALVGDAGFVARPHVGVGVLKAALDAQELTRCLSENASVSEALEQYQKARRQSGRDAVEFGRHLGGFISRGSESPWADADDPLTAEYIIRVTAKPVPPSSFSRGS